MSEKYLGQLDTLSNLFEKVTNDAAATLLELAIARRQIADLKAKLADANRGAQVNALVNESLAKKLKLAVEALEYIANLYSGDARRISMETLKQIGEQQK